MQPANTTKETSPPLSAREVGAEMARLRAGFGLSQHEVSERLHIRSRYVVAIEAGRLDELPGKVYARGYVQTYAEFLGLDPARILAQCFAGEGAVSNAVQHRPLPDARATATTIPTSRRVLVIPAVVVGALLWFAGHWWMDDAGEQPVEFSVAPVPDDMLVSVRNRVMPTQDNLECLTSESLLACYFADETTQALSTTWNKPLYFAQDLGVSELELLAPQEETVSETQEEPVATDRPHD